MYNLKRLIDIRKDLTYDENILIAIFGFLGLITIWQLAVTVTNIPPQLLPTPLSVVLSFKELIDKNHLWTSLSYSCKLNIYGYAEAVVVSLPVGFLIGLFPISREAMRKPLDTMRFLPLPAMTGIFIAWFGIEDNMKIQFLAFSIMAYLIPVVVQRIQEIPEVYVQTIKTLSNSRWSLISTVFIPAGIEAIYEDIRVLVAISWTYIMVAEMVNQSGGLGSIIYLAARQGRTDKVFAILLVIIGIGLIQDRLFKLFGDFIFYYKNGGR